MCPIRSQPRHRYIQSARPGVIARKDEIPQEQRLVKSAAVDRRRPQAVIVAVWSSVGESDGNGAENAGSRLRLNGRGRDVRVDDERRKSGLCYRSRILRALIDIQQQEGGGSDANAEAEGCVSCQPEQIVESARRPGRTQRGIGW